MTTLTDRISQREEWVVASLLDNLDETWGPNIWTALAHVEYWHSEPARSIATAINKCVDNLTLANIGIKLGWRNARWLRHQTFHKNGLPLALAEYEAYELCAYYRTKRLERLLGEAQHKVKSHPEAAKVVAQSLSAALKEYT